MTVKPRQPAPALEFKLLDDSTWSLANAKPANFQLVVFYRGLHCPICKMYTNDLESKLPEFAKRGVDVVAVSMENKERAGRTKSDWGLNNLKIGYGLNAETAKAWELFLSSGHSDAEPAVFNEPGVFLVKADGNLFYAARSSAPWGRPAFEQILRGIDFVTEKKLPARGEL